MWVIRSLWTEVFHRPRGSWKTPAWACRSGIVDLTCGSSTRIFFVLTSVSVRAVVQRNRISARDSHHTVRGGAAERAMFQLVPAAAGTHGPPHGRLVRVVCTSGTPLELSSEQAYVPAEQSASRQDPRFPAAHAYPCRPRDHRCASAQGAQSADRQPLGVSSQTCNGPVCPLRQPVRLLLFEGVLNRCCLHATACGVAPISTPPCVTGGGPAGTLSASLSSFRRTLQTSQVETHLLASGSASARRWGKPSSANGSSGGCVTSCGSGSAPSPQVAC